MLSSILVPITCLLDRGIPLPFVSCLGVCAICYDILYPGTCRVCPFLASLQHLGDWVMNSSFSLPSPKQLLHAQEAKDVIGQGSQGYSVFGSFIPKFKNDLVVHIFRNLASNCLSVMSKLSATSPWRDYGILFSQYHNIAQDDAIWDTESRCRGEISSMLDSSHLWAKKWALAP